MENEIKKDKKVLVIEDIEDDASIREIMRDKLLMEGFRVLEAVNGEEGLAVALDQHPDLILLDILMPKLNGIDMMKKLRQSNAWGKDVPIILLTNLTADSERINKAITENEPSYYLVKSDWSMEDLVEKIKERLARPA